MMLAFAGRAADISGIPGLPDREWILIAAIAIMIFYGTFNVK